MTTYYLYRLPDLEPIYPLGYTKKVPDWFHEGTAPVNKNKKHKKK